MLSAQPCCEPPEPRRHTPIASPRRPLAWPHVRGRGQRISARVNPLTRPRPVSWLRTQRRAKHGQQLFNIDDVHVSGRALRELWDRDVDRAEPFLEQLLTLGLPVSAQETFDVVLRRKLAACGRGVELGPSLRRSRGECKRS